MRGGPDSAQLKYKRSLCWDTKAPHLTLNFESDFEFDYEREGHLSVLRVVEAQGEGDEGALAYTTHTNQ
jgi:hypothetical protein